MFSPFQSVFALDSSFSVTETQANVEAWVNDQTNVSATPTPNDAGTPETKASQTLTVWTRPANSESITIGTCVVTFLDGAGTWDNTGSPSDDTDCSGWATINNYTLTNPWVARTPTEIANVLDSLTNVVDAVHGTLAVTADTATTTKFTTSGAENSATNITFTDGTSGKITNVAVSWVISVPPTAQISTITPANVEAGDTFTATINNLAINFIATTGTVANVTAGLTNAINLSAQNGNVTAVDKTTYVQITSDIPGTLFIIASSATNRPAVAQVVDFTPLTPTQWETFRATINETNYDYTVVWTKTVAEVVTGLQVLMNAEWNTTCVDNSSKITCTADVPWTSFTYWASVVDITSPVFSSLTVTSNNANQLFAKTDDNLTFTLNLNPADTVWSGNNVAFNIWATTLVTWSFTSSSNKQTTRNKNYTILTWQNWAFDITGLTFLDAAGNSITWYVDPSINITIDTTSPAITISNDTVAWPVQSDTVVATLVETNANTFAYWYSADAVCNSWDTYPNAYVSWNSITENTETNNGKYICFKAVDLAWNISYAWVTNPLNIDITQPTASIAYSDADGIVKSWDSLTITATFNEALSDLPVVKIALSWSNTQIATNMTKTDSTHYTYIHTVGAGNGATTVALSIGTDVAGNIITATPISGETFTVDNTAPTNQNTVFTTSVTKIAWASVTIISSWNVTNNVWFAPAGTVTFAEWATITKATNWTATSILAPATAWDYKLFVIDAAGNISTASTAILTVLEWVNRTITLQSGWNVFSTPNTLSSIEFSNAWAGITFYKLEWWSYSQISANTGSILPLAWFLINNTSWASVDSYLTNKTGLTANEKLHQKTLLAGWNILGTTTNTSPYNTIWASATSIVDLTNGVTNPNKVHTSFSSSPVYETWEAYGVFMSANGIYGWNE